MTEVCFIVSIFVCLMLHLVFGICLADTPMIQTQIVLQNCEFELELAARAGVVRDMFDVLVRARSQCQQLAIMCSCGVNEYSTLDLNSRAQWIRALTCMYKSARSAHKQANQWIQRVNA
jgi:hypothetical protein